MASTPTATPLRSRRLPHDAPGVADTRMLPDEAFKASWEAIYLPEGDKDLLARSVASGFVLRSQISFEKLPLHGLILLVGEPGVGKTTIARGLADRVARMVTAAGDFAYVEIDPHRLTSSALGRSQREVENLFSQTLGELATTGPLVVLIDEVETLATERSRLSFDTNPADVHRAVDAALVGLDRVARSHKHVALIATSNFPDAVDEALTSRADLVYPVPLPGEAGRRAILADTISALAQPYPLLDRLTTARVLDEAAAASEGMDGRRIRKAFATACAMRDESVADPNQLTEADLLRAIELLRRSP